VRDDGATIVLIRIGETLAGLEELGITVAPPAPVPPIVLPQPTTVLRISPPVVVQAEEPVEEIGSIDVHPLWWLLLLALLLVAAVPCIQWVLSRRTFGTADPVTAGPPMINGGLSDATADEAFRRMAERQTGLSFRSFTVLQSIAGQVYGTMIVSYADGKERRMSMNGQRAYQARVRFPNGHEESLYMLQACGNDLRFGGINRYRPGGDFRFTPEVRGSIVPAPARTMTSPSSAETTTEVVPEGTIRVEIKPADGTHPTMIRVSGVNPVGTQFTMDKSGFTLRYS
jgi:hypothetical protein